MKIITLALLLVIASVSLFILYGNPERVYAEVTSIEVGLSENITLGDITVGPSDALVALVEEAAQSYEDSMNSLVAAIKFGAGILLVLGMLVISLWRQKVFLLAVSGLVAFFIGITWVSDNAGVSYSACFIGAFQLLSALLLALESDTPASGMSKFRGMINKFREWF